MRIGISETIFITQLARDLHYNFDTDDAEVKKTVLRLR